MKISILIPTFNCESTIERTLDSVKWADQIIIVDSYSTDNTLNIIKSFDVILYQNHYINSANQKNWALKYCENEWVLQIDSDEVIEPNSENIFRHAIKSANDNVHCFMMPRRNHILGRWLKNGGLYPDWQNRLFKTKFSKWDEKDVHSKIKVPGEIQKISTPIMHYGMPNLSKQLSNLNRYTRYETDYLIRKGKKYSFFKMLFGPFFVFIYRYFFLRGFLDGWRGFFHSTYIAIYYFITQCKLYEISILKLNKSPE